MSVADETKYMRIVTPADKDIHFVSSRSSNNKLMSELFISPTTTADGTDRTSNIFNVNENSSNTTSLEIYEDPTVSNDGTLRDIAITDASSEARSARELLLKRSTVYLMKVTATSNSTSVGVRLTWYEED